MSFKSSSIALSALAVLGLSQAVQAGPFADATKDNLWGVELGGYLDLSSTYNLNDPVTDANAGRIFDTDDGDVIDFNAFNLYLDRLPEDAGDVGFRVDMIIGEDANLIGGNDGVLSNDDFNVYQAYISYIAPVGNGITIDVGRFATWHGYEVIESPANDQFSRSFLFGLAIPFTHTGFRAGYDFNDWVSASVGVTQGWDTVEDNNDSLTVHGALYLQPTEELFIGNSFAYGPEKTGDNADNTFLWDLVATYQITDQILLGANFDYANQENSVIGGGDAEWYGAAGYIRYDFREDMYGAVRGEFFDDSDGARTGAPGNEFWEITVTYGYQVTDQLLGRIEYRHDEADTPFFDDDSGVGVEDSQDTIAFEIIYSF
jgi:hypothetical protein